MNVRPLPNTTRFVFRVDIVGIREMLDDYFASILRLLEHPPDRGADAGIIFIAATVERRSGRFSTSSVSPEDDA
jgi:hypothetical protein